MSTSCPAIRMYRLKTSEGTPNPATWPRWRGPLAYGQATAESTFMRSILGVGGGALAPPLGPRTAQRLHSYGVVVVTLTSPDRSRMGRENSVESLWR